MPTPLKLSPRLAGVTQTEDYCPRCLWYDRHVKKLQSPMPGIMFNAESMEKAFMYEYLKKHGRLPRTFGRFADCKEPVSFPFRMEAYHSDSGVILTAQIDSILRTRRGNLAVLDLKTSNPSGGGSILHPQYHMQVTGYGWVAEANDLGRVEAAGLVFFFANLEKHKKDPLIHATEEGPSFPFRIETHELEPDYEKLTKAVKEVKKVLLSRNPPRGRDDCKKCAVLSLLFDQEIGLRKAQFDMARRDRDFRELYYQQEHFRYLARHVTDLEDILKEAEALADDDDRWDTLD